MAKKALLSIDSTYHKVKKGYITLDSAYRRIKKAYITIGGVYRPCWAGGELIQYGLTVLNEHGRYGIAAATIGNYAMFAGGIYPDSRGEAHIITSEITVFDKSLTKSSEILPEGRQQMVAVTHGDYAIFAGGNQGNSAITCADDVYAYNKSLTLTTPSVLEKPTYEHAAATVGDYALFGGGFYLQSCLKNVNVYDKSLTRINSVELSYHKSKLSATSVGDYALFAGGYFVGSVAGEGGYSNGSAIKEVDAFDKSLTRTTLHNFTSGRYYMSAASVGSYALFVGGVPYTTTAHAYNKSLTHSTLTAYDRDGQGATTLGDFAIFAGGRLYSNGTLPTNVVEAFDDKLTRSFPPDLTKARREIAAATINNYALFAGGYADPLFVDNVDMYALL